MSGMGRLDISRLNTKRASEEFSDAAWIQLTDASPEAPGGS